MTIVEFLEARIAEDEAAADAADGPAWESGDGNISEGGMYANGWSIAWFELGMTNQTAAGHVALPAFANWQRHAHQNSVHAARHDPARVLAECKAKRDILTRHVTWKISRDPGWEEALPGVDTVCGYCTSERGDRWVPDPCPDIRAVASVYADHPDFDTAWG